MVAGTTLSQLKRRAYLFANLNSASIKNANLKNKVAIAGPVNFAKEALSMMYSSCLEYCN